MFKAMPTVRWLSRNHRLADIRIRFGTNSEARINDQINREYTAMYMYEAMTSYYGRPSVGLSGFKKYFKKAADEEREHAHKLIDYLNKRGGHVKLKPITPYRTYEWASPLDATKLALEAEKKITTDLYALRDQADMESDAHLVDFIESEFLVEQVNGIKELRELIARLSRAGSGLGEIIIDKELL